MENESLTGQEYIRLDYQRAYYKKHRERIKARTSLYQKNNGFKYSRIWAKNNPSKTKYNRLRTTFKGSMCSREEFSNWYLTQLRNCYYCGISEEKLKGYSKLEERLLTIDKLVPDLGYILGNMVFACRKCNRVKSDVLTSEEMKQVANLILIHKEIK